MIVKLRCWAEVLSITGLSMMAGCAVQGSPRQNAAEEIAATETDAAVFRFDVRKVFSPGEIADLCNQNRAKLDQESLERCLQKRPAYVTSRAAIHEWAKYRAMVPMPSVDSFSEGDVIEMQGRIERGNSDLRFTRVVCRAADDDCKKDPSRGSTGRIDPANGIGDVQP